MRKLTEEEEFEKLCEQKKLSQNEEFKWSIRLLCTSVLFMSGMGGLSWYLTQSILAGIISGLIALIFEGFIASLIIVVNLSSYIDYLNTKIKND